MKYLALDQNRWIELSDAIADPKANPKHYRILEYLLEEVDAKRLIIPLFQSNIYETHKIKKKDVRTARAYVQCALSNGLVVLGLSLRRSVEIRRVLAMQHNGISFVTGDDWFLSNRFWEAASLADAPMADYLIQIVENDPREALFSYLTFDDGARAEGLEMFSNAINELLTCTEEQRQRLAGENLSMRRKALSVVLWIDSQDAIWAEVDFLGIETTTFKQSSPTLMKDLIRRVPCLYIERELRLVLEAESGTLTPNDAMDMQFFCAALPYMNVVAAEKGFTSRALQAKLGEKFGTTLVTDLEAIPEALSGFP